MDTDQEIRIELVERLEKELAEAETAWTVVKDLKKQDNGRYPGMSAAHKRVMDARKEIKKAKSLDVQRKMITRRRVQDKPPAFRVLHNDKSAIAEGEASRTSQSIADNCGAGAMQGPMPNSTANSNKGMEIEKIEIGVTGMDSSKQDQAASARETTNEQMDVDQTEVEPQRVTEPTAPSQIPEKSNEEMEVDTNEDTANDAEVNGGIDVSLSSRQHGDERVNDSCSGNIADEDVIRGSIPLSSDKPTDAMQGDQTGKAPDVVRLDGVALLVREQETDKVVDTNLSELRSGEEDKMSIPSEEQSSAADPVGLSEKAANSLVNDSDEDETLSDQNRPLPQTAQEMLDFVFQFEPVDWEDEDIIAPMRLAEESDEQHRLQTDLYCRKYELSNALRQAWYLKTVLTAVDDAWGNGHLPIRTGSDKVSLLKSEMAAMSMKISNFKAAVQESKKRYYSYLEATGNLHLEKTLAKEVEMLIASFTAAPPEQLLEIRDKLVAVKAKLEEVAAMNAAAAKNEAVIKNTKKGRKRSKGRQNAVEGDEEDSTPPPEHSGDGPNNERSVWYKHDDEERQKMEAKGIRQLERVINAATPELRQTALKNIGVSIRCAAREVQEFLPESSYLSKDIALRIHYASSRNLVCRYHSRNRNPKVFEHDTVITLNGIGHPKAYNSKGNAVTPQPGHMNCGCEIDEVLLEFYFWKTFRTTSSNENIKTLFSVPDDFPPKFRHFWVQHWKDLTGLTVNDIYSLESGGGLNPCFLTRLIVKQVDKLASVGIGISVAPKGERDAAAIRSYLDGWLKKNNDGMDDDGMDDDGMDDDGLDPEETPHV